MITAGLLSLSDWNTFEPFKLSYWHSFHPPKNRLTFRVWLFAFLCETKKKRHKSYKNNPNWFSHSHYTRSLTLSLFLLLFFAKHFIFTWKYSFRKMFLVFVFIANSSPVPAGLLPPFCAPRLSLLPCLSQLIDLPHSRENRKKRHWKERGWERRRKLFVCGAAS